MLLCIGVLPGGGKNVLRKRFMGNKSGGYYDTFGSVSESEDRFLRRKLMLFLYLFLFLRVN